MLGHFTDDRIIALDSRRSAGARPDCFAALATYWTALADGRIMPFRDEIDPQELDAILDRTFLLERFAPGMARFRLAGQQMCEILEMDLRGMPFSALFTAGARDAVQQSLTAVFAEPARCELVLQGQRRGIRGRMAGGMLILPLRDRSGEVSRAIGCLSVSGPSMAAPQRFDLVNEDRRTLLGYGKKPETPAVDAPNDPFESADAARDRLRQRRDMRAKLTVISNHGQ